MIVISLVLVIAAAVSLFIGLFVVTETLTFIWGAIGLCLVSLLLLWLGTRQRKGAGPTEPSAPVYGGAARAGGSTTPARTAAGDDLDSLTAPEGGGTVVRKTTARDRAATRVADDSGEPADASAAAAEETPVEAATADATGDTEAVSTDTVTTAAAATPPAKKAVARKSTKKATAKKAAKKSTAKKSTAKKTTAKKTAKKSSAKKATAKKASTKKASTRKSTAKKSTAGTSGAAARARLAQIAGVGPAKQDALLSQFGSLEGIRDASVDDIVSNVRGFGEALATRVKNELS